MSVFFGAYDEWGFPLHGFSLGLQFESLSPKPVLSKQTFKETNWVRLNKTIVRFSHYQFGALSIMCQKTWNLPNRKLRLTKFPVQNIYKPPRGQLVELVGRVLTFSSSTSLLYRQSINFSASPHNTYLFPCTSSHHVLVIMHALDLRTYSHVRPHMTYILYPMNTVFYRCIYV